MIPRDDGRRQQAPNENAGGQADVKKSELQSTLNLHSTIKHRGDARRFAMSARLESYPARRITRKRAKRFGDGPSVELDAIHPETLRELVAGAIAEHMPAERYASLMAEQATERVMMREWAGQMSNDERDAP